MKKHIGLLTAIAIGDSYGRSFEFATKDKIDPELDLNIYYPGMGKYSDGYKGGIGKYTDDTQMSIAIAEHMLQDRPITPDDYAEMLMTCYNRDKRNGYSKRIQYLLEISNNPDTFQYNLGIQKPRDSNGCVIRCLPLGLYPDVNQVKHACIVQASLTHPTMDCILASQIMALTVHYLHYGNKKTYINWITDHVPMPMFNYIMDKYILGRQINCDAAETASYCLNIAFRQSKFKKLVPTPAATVSPKVWNAHTNCFVGGYTTYTPTPEATMSQILKHAIVEAGGDTDSTAAIGLGLASIRGAKNDLNISLYNNLENGLYGRDYLMELDKKLLEKFPKIPAKPEKIKVKVETTPEKEAREKKEREEQLSKVHPEDIKCTCSKCVEQRSLIEKSELLANNEHIALTKIGSEIYTGFHTEEDGERDPWDMLPRFGF